MWEGGRESRKSEIPVCVREREMCIDSDLKLLRGLEGPGGLYNALAMPDVPRGWV